MSFWKGSIAFFIFCLLLSNGSGERRSRSPKKEDTGTLFPEEDSDKVNDPEEVTPKKKLGKGELYLPPDYNKYEIPQDSLIVRTHVRIREIQDLNELDGQISVVMDVRLWWTDWQIWKANQDAINPTGEGFVISLNEETEETKSKKLDPSFLQKIWKPDLVMESLIETSRPEFIAKPIKVVYQSDGNLIFQSRLTVTLSCSMDFHYYPADSQECKFRIRSYSFETSELELEWGYPSPSIYAFDRQNSNFEIQVTKPSLEQLTEDSLDVDQAEIGHLLFGTEKPPRKNETFDVLTFSIRARRKMSYHLIQTYVPSVFFIAITWLCFFIPPTMVECRIGITMTTLLTLTAMFASVRESSPIVSYCKAIDIWMIACVAFVFLCLFEFALLVWFGLTKEEEVPQPYNGKVEAFELELREKLQIGTVELDGTEDGRRSRRDKMRQSGAAVARKVELFAVPIYLLLFVLFQLMYWPWLLGSSGFFDWTVDPTYNAPDAT